MSDKKELYLNLAFKWFDMILSGEKTEEYREFKDYWVKKLCKVNKKGEITGLIKYDTVRFQRGYTSPKKQMVVEIKEIKLDFETDEENNFIPEKSEFVIYLGKILERINC